MDNVVTDEANDIVDCLFMLQWATKNDFQQGRSWNWALIAAHNAPQATSVAHLTGTEGLGTLKVGCEQALYAWLNGGCKGLKAQEDSGRFARIEGTFSPPSARNGPRNLHDY